MSTQRNTQLVPRLRHWASQAQQWLDLRIWRPLHRQIAEQSYMPRSLGIGTLAFAMSSQTAVNHAAATPAGSANGARAAANAGSHRTGAHTPPTLSPGDEADELTIEYTADDGTAPADGRDVALVPAPEPQTVEVSHRFPRGLLPSRDPCSYLLSPMDLLTRRAENVRRLRTHLKLRLGDHGVVLLASPRHGDGRSITALNLGLAFAQQYERVVYVEADFRRPALHTFFTLDQGRGLSRLLQRHDPVSEDLGDELFPTDVPGFYLLPAGVRSGPPELFESPRMAEVIERLKEEADWAIIDVPPMLTYADGTSLAKLVDGVVVVALEGRTKEDDLARLVSQLETSNANIVGAVYVQRG